MSNYFTSLFNAISDPKTRNRFRKGVIDEAVVDAYMNSLQGKSTFDAVILAIDEENPAEVITSNASEPLIRVAKVRPLDIQEKTLPNPCDYNEPEQIRYVTSMHPTAYSEGIGGDLLANAIAPGDIVECFYSIDSPNNKGKQRGLRFRYARKGRASGNYPVRCLQLLGATVKGGKIVVQETFNTSQPVKNIGDDKTITPPPGNIAQLAQNYDSDTTIPNKSQHAEYLGVNNDQFHPQFVPFVKAVLYSCWNKLNASFELNSAFRTVKRQAEMKKDWDDWVKQKPPGNNSDPDVKAWRAKKPYAGQPASAGYSKHNLGTACDFNTTIGNKTYTSRDDKSTWEDSGVPSMIKSLGLRWGGDFSNNYDPIHFDYEVSNSIREKIIEATKDANSKSSAINDMKNIKIY